MKSLLAGAAFAAIVIAALAVARSQTMPDASPSICPSPSITNGLVDSTLQHDCVTPQPPRSPSPKKVAPPTPQPSPLSSGTPRPTAQPTSKAQMR